MRLPDGLLGDRLVAHHLDRLRLGPDELDVARLALLGELRVLRQEAVPGMDGVDVGDLGRADDPVGPQVAVGAAAGPPMQMASSASCTWSDWTSASE